MDPERFGNSWAYSEWYRRPRPTQHKGDHFAPLIRDVAPKPLRMPGWESARDVPRSAFEVNLLGTTHSGRPQPQINVHDVHDGHYSRPLLVSTRAAVYPSRAPPEPLCEGRWTPGFVAFYDQSRTLLIACQISAIRQIVFRRSCLLWQFRCALRCSPTWGRVTGVGSERSWLEPQLVGAPQNSLLVDRRGS